MNGEICTRDIEGHYKYLITKLKPKIRRCLENEKGKHFLWQRKYAWIMKGSRKVKDKKAHSNEKA